MNDETVIDLSHVVSGAPGGGYVQSGNSSPRPYGAPPRLRPQPFFKHKTVKMIELTIQGNYVVDIPVADKVVIPGKFRSGHEFTHMRYSAVTGDPDDFVEKGFTLRQADGGRTTELFVVVTMYNENETLFIKTWKSIVKNVTHLSSKRKSSVWGAEGWKKVVVCVVADGRTKIHEKTLGVLGVMGVYQDGVMKTSVNGQDVAAHVFEYSPQLYLESDMTIKGCETGAVPIQTIFCLKERNAKKINSHRWFFNAFGKNLKPNVCILIDVGTKPTDRSFHRLWRALSMVAGACGEIAVEKSNCGFNLVNPLVAAQNFEYKMSNILDKPFESVIGFISVLPGAFSAYRYRALQNGADGSGPLQKYFLGEKLDGAANLTQANMYLAEDRILCFELVTKRSERWVLKYVRRAKAQTDVPDGVAEFISQRRRWLNGSFFASVHSVVHFYQIFRSGHSFLRKLALLLQTLYNLITIIFNWFAIGNWYLILYFLASGMGEREKARLADGFPPDGPFYGQASWIILVIRNVYLLAIVLIFVSSLGNRPAGSKNLYIGCFLLFAIVMAAMLYISAWTVYHTIPKKAEEWAMVQNYFLQPAFRDIVLSLMSTYGIYLLASLLYVDPWHMIHSMVQYMLLLPSFVNILMVFAFCNLHDVSWGTKGDNLPQQDPAPLQTQKTQDGKQVATVNLPDGPDDVDMVYDRVLKTLHITKAYGAKDEKKRLRTKTSNSGRDSKTKQEDYFKLFRTNVVILWLFSNALLLGFLSTPQIAEFLSPSDPQLLGNVYLAVILWSVAGLSFTRFFGAITYLIMT
ncbi:chitin synthase-domain-containing protein [Cladochytrium replicatum]|nr:chitin synthase-domain-containing protein [Cladochytrium replicatum]